MKLNLGTLLSAGRRFASLRARHAAGTGGG